MSDAETVGVNDFCDMEAEVVEVVDPDGSHRHVGVTPCCQVSKEVHLALEGVEPYLFPGAGQEGIWVEHG